MAAHPITAEVFEEVGNMVKGIASPHRLAIIDVLSNGEKSVEELASDVDLSVANTSQHLQQMKRSHWVQTRREKNYIFYSLKNPYVYAIWKTIREIARLQNPAINGIMDSYRKANNIRTIRFDQMDEGTLIDARPHAEFQSGHLTRAVRYSKDQAYADPVFIYSRGPFCVLADQVVIELTRNGHDAFRIEEGYKDLAKD